MADAQNGWHGKIESKETIFMIFGQTIHKL